MANPDQPLGARPYGQVRSLSTYISGSAVYPGDFVSRDSSGRVIPVAVDGSSYVSSSCGVAMNYCSAAGQDLLVADDPAQKFVVQSSTADIDAQTDMNLNYTILATAPDTVYKKSKMELKGDTGAVTATLPLKLISIDREVNNALGSKVNVIVKINNHELGESTGTAGI